MSHRQERMRCASITQCSANSTAEQITSQTGLQMRNMGCHRGFNQRWKPDTGSETHNPSLNIASWHAVWQSSGRCWWISTSDSIPWKITVMFLLLASLGSDVHRAVQHGKDCFSKGWLMKFHNCFLCICMHNILQYNTLFATCKLCTTSAKNNFCF